ncbi:SGNH/GDSL hydrolase family protein [Novosphingobium sp.]|uniref:SGNH/GDSL hydrolase family protein n=1 Tax=Novosphingobium sp. TaxID=1874826 RepID=UPI0026159F4D|nr:SGNH/GDSL hydrolase family protein [Novosphingobium sp.]
MKSVLFSPPALLLALATPALADTPQPEPPGKGMIEQPCPDVTGLWFASPYVKQYDWAFLCRYAAENAALDPAQPVRAVFIGDSITEGWKGKAPDLFGAEVLDRGISGQTTPQLLVRFSPDVLALHPRVVHIMGGTNDLAGNTGPNSIDQFRANIRAMVTLAKANGITVIIGSILPADHFNWSPGLQPARQIAELNGWLRKFAADNGLVYADYYSALAGPAGELPAAYSGDGVHPNAAGYAVMEPIARRALEKAEALAGPPEDRR